MSRRVKIIAGAAVMVVAAIVAAILWWSLRDDGPEAVGLGAAVAQLEAATRDDTGGSSSTEPDGGDSVAPLVEPTENAGTALSAATGDVPSTGAGGGPETAAVDAEPGGGDSVAPPVEPTGDAPSAGAGNDPDAAPSGAEASGLAGVWTLVRAEGEDAPVGDRPASFAGYRVMEVLVGGIDENTVVGRTDVVDGYIELTGTALVGATVQVEMATLRTDDSHRDSHMRQALNTKEFPLATFALVEPVELPAGSFDGEPFAGTAVGDLTIKGVTNRSVFNLQAQLVGDAIVVVGSSEVVFSDYGVTAPTSAVVVSVEDHGVMEFQLYFTR